MTLAPGENVVDASSEKCSLWVVYWYRTICRGNLGLKWFMFDYLVEVGIFTPVWKCQLGHREPGIPRR